MTKQIAGKFITGPKNTITKDNDKDVPYPCAECGELWVYGSGEDLGARYYINERWLCASCHCKENENL